MLCPFCNQYSESSAYDREQGWTCQICGGFIPPIKTLMETRNSYLRKHAKRFFIDNLFPQFKTLTFVQYNTAKVCSYADVVKLKELLSAIADGIMCIEDWPKCQYCGFRPTYYGKPYCRHAECVKRSYYHKNPMVRDPYNTLRKIKQTMKERYGVENCNELDFIRKMKSEKQKKIWTSLQYRIKRANNINDKLGVYNLKQNPEIIQFIRQALGLENNVSYDVFMNRIFDIFCTLQNVNLLEPKTFHEFLLRQGEGKNSYLYQCKKCGLVFKRYTPVIAVAYEKLKNNLEIITCPRCQRGKSLLEQRLINDLLPLGSDNISIKTNDHMLITPYEIDVVLQNNNRIVCIDVDGIFYHSTQHLKSFSKNAKDLYEMIIHAYNKNHKKYEKIIQKGLLYYCIQEHKINEYILRCISQTLQNTINIQNDFNIQIDNDNKIYMFSHKRLIANAHFQIHGRKVVISDVFFKPDQYVLSWPSKLADWFKSNYNLDRCEIVVDLFTHTYNLMQLFDRNFLENGTYQNVKLRLINGTQICNQTFTNVKDVASLVLDEDYDILFEPGTLTMYF